MYFNHHGTTTRLGTKSSISRRPKGLRARGSKSCEHTLHNLQEGLLQGALAHQHRLLRKKKYQITKMYKIKYFKHK